MKHTAIIHNINYACSNETIKAARMSKAESRVKSLDCNQTEIVIKAWTDEDWAIGAGTLALPKIYKSPIMR